MKSNPNTYSFITKVIAFYIMLSLKLAAQIYNYDPIRHSNFETNPSYLASDKNYVTASLVHHGAFFEKDKFYYDGLRVSFYNPKYFAGIGITLNNTHVNDSAQYSYVGIGGAYRTVLFNKIYTRIGFIYKANYVTAPSGYFSYYSLNRSGENSVKTNLIHNANISVSLSSGREKFYISMGILNAQLFSNPNQMANLFPEYYFVNVGDFGKMMGLEDWEISYSTFAKKYSFQNISPLSHYLNIFYKGFHFTRNISLRYGARIGLTDNEYFQCTPSISLYLRLTRKKYIICHFSYDTGISIKTSQLPFNPTAQFNLTYLF